VRIGDSQTDERQRTDWNPQAKKKACISARQRGTGKDPVLEVE
jgi:hypothetical protein